jgi:hypothetical protein
MTLLEPQRIKSLWEVGDFGLRFEPGSVEKNQFKVTGGEVVVAHNTSPTDETLTILRWWRPRHGSIFVSGREVAHTIKAGTIASFYFWNTIGFADYGGNIHFFVSSAGVLVALIRLFAPGVY